MPSRARRLCRAAPALGVALVVAIGLGMTASGASATTGRGRDLPPASRDALARAFDPALADLGLQTTRAGLQDPDHGFRYSKRGTHLAVYVEPTTDGAVDGAAYVKNIVASARVYLPTVFRRWPGLTSFDVCLEPEPRLNPSPLPPPVTQLQVSKDAAADVHWKTVTLGKLLKVAAAGGASESGDREKLFLYISPQLHDEPAYVRARAAAGLPPVTTTPTTAPQTAYGPSA